MPYVCIVGEESDPYFGRPSMLSSPTDLAVFRQFPTDANRSMPFPMDSATTISIFGRLGENQADSHYKGHKHVKKLKSKEGTKACRHPDSLSLAAAPANPCSSTESACTDAPTAPADHSERADAFDQGLHDSTRSWPAVQLSQVFTDPPKQSSVLSTSPSTNTTHTGAGDDWTVKAEVVEENVGETEEQKMKRLLYCSLCKVAVNSLSQLQGHNKGARHKAMLEGKDPPFMRRPSRHKSTAGAAKASSAARVKDFHCELCQLKVNSDTQLQQHLASRRHKDKLAGKPPKPKFSPYSKLQRKSSSLFPALAFPKELVSSLQASFLPTPLITAATIQAKLALHKGLGKSLTTTSFLPTPLAVAAATAVSMGTPFALRTLPGASAIFPRPILAQTLLRPAPGPMRSTPHGAILFAPY
uniref:C2H2-type domain-containing protein n=1 Tax=Eptatretus burgeri TaxID=7764 RepID=A0A8C4R451_EPTBU